MSVLYRNGAETTNVRYSGIWIALALAGAAVVFYTLYGFVNAVSTALTKGLQF